MCQTCSFKTSKSFFAFGRSIFWILQIRSLHLVNRVFAPFPQNGQFNKFKLVAYNRS